MFATSPATTELSDAWIEGDESARWRSTSGHAGDGVLHFVAVYAADDVTTTYEDDVQPDGGRERDPLP